MVTSWQLVCRVAPKTSNGINWIDRTTINVPVTFFKFSLKSFILLSHHISFTFSSLKQISHIYQYNTCTSSKPLLVVLWFIDSNVIIIRLIVSSSSSSFSFFFSYSSSSSLSWSLCCYCYRIIGIGVGISISISIGIGISIGILSMDRIHQDSTFSSLSSSPPLPPPAYRHYYRYRYRYRYL